MANTLSRSPLGVRDNRSLPLTAKTARDLPAAVYRLVRRIPAGRVTTYGAIARALNRPDAVRAVARALKENTKTFLVDRGPDAVPCHRVVRSTGHLGGYNGGVDAKLNLLRSEGVPIPSHGRIDLNTHGWVPPQSK